VSLNETQTNDGFSYKKKQINPKGKMHRKEEGLRRAEI